MIDLALLSIRPGAEWIINGDTYEGLEWLDVIQTKPTKEEIEQEIVRLQEIFSKESYKRDREKNYPKIADQLDMLWHAIDTGILDKTSDFYLSLKQVKDSYPKP